MLTHWLLGWELACARSGKAITTAAAGGRKKGEKQLPAGTTEHSCSMSDKQALRDALSLLALVQEISLQTTLHSINLLGGERNTATMQTVWRAMLSVSQQRLQQGSDYQGQHTVNPSLTSNAHPAAVAILSVLQTRADLPAHLSRVEAANTALERGAREVQDALCALEAVAEQRAFPA